ncbi:MAG: MFS transporter [Deltaproteobacteria bacterium]|jgi:FSR family fosmidomycin resistance protein-like MFS transporter|nr:MFS transporter [Deltaproteobacteria bacterium]
MQERINPYIYLLSAGHLFTDLNQGALPVIIPFFIAEYGFNYTTAASLVFALNLVSSIVQPVFGALADRAGKPWILPAAVLLAGGGMAATGVLTSYAEIFAAVIISGIGIAAFHPEAARCANQISGQRKGTGVSVFGCGGTVGLALGPIFASWLILTFGLKGLTALFIPVAAIAPVLLIVMNRRHLHEKAAGAAGSPRQKAGGTDRWGAFSLLCALVFSRSIIFYGLNTFLPLYWIHVFKQSAAAASAALSSMLVVGAVSTLIGGRMADRFGFHKLIRGGFLFLLPLLGIFVFTTNAAAATLLLIPIGFALYAPLTPMIVTGQKFLPNHIGLSSGVTLGLSVSIGGIAAPFLGRVADLHGLLPVMYILAAVAVLPAFLAFALPKPHGEA